MGVDEHPSGQIGDAYFAEVDPTGKVRETYSGESGIRKTFFRATEDTPVILAEEISQQWGVVERFIQELIVSEIPLRIKTRSAIGDVGENLYLSFHSREAVPEDWDENMGGEPLSGITFCIYAEGNGAMVPAGQFGLVGHRDLVLAEDEQGEFVYTDHRLRDEDYLPPTAAGWTFDRESLEHFRNTKTIERWKPDDFDPYNVGIGSLLQATAVAWFMHYRNADRIKTRILLADGERMWEKYGLNTETGVFDREKAIRQITADVFHHIR